MSVKDVSCLYSKLRNISGQRQVFTFLPPHGRTLEAGEEFIMFGNPQDAIANGGASRNSCRRRILAFENAIANGDLIIVHSEAVILESPNETTKMLSMANGGTVSAATPCWENDAQSISSAF